jgi:hypothetical protein
VLIRAGVCGYDSFIPFLTTTTTTSLDSHLALSDRASLRPNALRSLLSLGQLTPSDGFRQLSFAVEFESTV